MSQLKRDNKYEKSSIFLSPSLKFDAHIRSCSDKKNRVSSNTKTVDISMRDGEGLWLKEKIIQIQQNLAYTKKKS